MKEYADNETQGSNEHSESVPSNLIAIASGSI